MKTILGTILLLAALPLAAHHSWSAEYKKGDPVTLQGTVTKVEWMNPHVLLWIDVKDATGKSTGWEIEMAPPNTMRRKGLTQAMLKLGDPVTVGGWLSKDRADLAGGTMIVLANGQAF